MNVNEYIRGIDCFIEKIKSGRFYAIAVADGIAHQSERIFVKGKATDGMRIGRYDNKRPMYVNPDKVPNKGGLLPLSGKSGKTAFASGKKHKTRYVKSYKQLRELMGLQTAFVDLVLFGNLKSDYENGGRGTGIVPLKVNDNVFQITMDSENSKKKEGLESRYGDIFKVSEKEESRLKEVGEKELISELEKCLQKS